MRLFTHNLLQCHVYGCTEKNFPLQLQECDLQPVEAEYNEDFMRGFFHKLDWKGILYLASHFNMASDLPQEGPEQPDSELLAKLHQLLFSNQILNGRMVCEGCGHVYPIRDGIPNMLLAEDEVK